MKMKNYIGKARYPFVASCILSLLNVVCTSYYPYVFSYIVDHFETLDRVSIIIISCTFVLSVILILVFSYLNKVAKAKYQEKICTAIRQDVFASIARMDYGVFHQQKKEKYTSFLVNDVEQLYTQYFENLIYFVNSIVMLVMYTIMLTFLNWQMCIVIMGSLMLIILLPQIVGKRFHELNASASAEKADYLSRCNEILSAHDLIDAENQDRLYKLYDTKLKSMQKKVYNQTKYRSFVQIASGAALYIQLILCFTAGLLFVYVGIISVGIFASSLLYVEYVAQYSANILDEFLEIRSSKVYREKCLELILAPTEEIGEYAEPFQELRMKEVTYRVGDRTLVENASYVFTKGKKYLIIGENGTGKSTLLKLLAGFLPPSAGQVIYNGREKRSRGDVGYIPQRRNIFEGSLLDNITLFSETSDEKLMEILTMCTKLHLKLPMETMIHSNGDNLSGGEIAKICLIRELYRGKGLLLIDEPLNDIDVESEEDILHFLLNLNQTIIMVAHGLSNKYHFDEVLRISDGMLKNFE